MAAPCLFVIARWDLDRYESARRYFAAEPEVEVVFDRRVAERRSGLERRSGRTSAGRDRRLGNRRRRDLGRDLAALGWAYVRRSEPAGVAGLPRAG